MAMLVYRRVLLRAKEVQHVLRCLNPGRQFQATAFGMAVSPIGTDLFSGEWLGKHLEDHPS